MNELVALDAGALSEEIRRRRVSCTEVMAAYLDHIEAVNPHVNAIVAMKERGAILAEARERDEELARGLRRGWMHGFPQAIKDLAATRDVPTSFGSPIFAGTMPAADDPMVERMRRAGAIIIGKTNTPEFGLGSQTYNEVFGTTLNAYDQRRTAGGSSGGAAVALALRMLPVADGSDHAGSLRNPAAFNNVLGLRPSFGRVPSTSHDVFMLQLGVPGPMARKVADLGRLLAVQAGYDSRAPLSIEQDPAVFAEVPDLAGEPKRIGWLGDLGGHLPFEPGILDLCQDALRVLESLGCRIEPVTPAFPPERIWQAWLVLRHFHVAATLADIHADPTLRDRLKPEAQWEVEQGLGISAVEVGRATKARTQWYQTVRALFERFDYLAIPSTQVFPFEAGLHWPKEIAGRAMDTYHRWMEVVIPVTMSGCPAIAVPVGFGTAGLPAGLQLVAPNHAELSLLSIAAAYESATGFVERHPPPLLCR